MRQLNKSFFDAGFKVAVVIALAIIISMQLTTDGSIVYVDAVKLMNGYTGMQQARKDYEAKTGIWQANVDSLKLELSNSIQEYQTKQQKLPVKEKALMEELLRTKQEQFMNYQQAVADKIQKEDQELTTKVLGKVNDYIKKYGEENDYEIIMAATQYGNIVYAQQGKDITDEILEGLNK
jgi:outer membrane protein